MISDVIRVVLAVGACHRIAQLLTIDLGPFHIFDNFRRALGRKAALSTAPTLYTALAELFNCPYCVGIWVSIIMVLPVLFPGAIGDIVLVGLGIAGYQSLFQDFSARLGKD